METIDCQPTIYHQLLTTNRRRGFTLIELLVVMVVLAALATISLISFQGQQRKASDARRLAELKQYQAGLETYANQHGGFYLISGQTNISGQCATLGFGTTCPDDPSGTNHYLYVSNVSGTSYGLWVEREMPPTGNFIIVCSDGRSGTGTVVPTASATCSLP